MDRTIAGTSQNAWRMLALLTLLNLLNFVDRQLLPSFANFIVPELGLTDTQFGLLSGLVFIVFYAVAGLFTGALADVVHRPRLIAGAACLWSALTAASGAAINFATMAIPRMLIGVGESALAPASMSLIAERFKASQLSFAAGIYYLGVPVGAGASLLVAGYLGPAIGWRNCFYLLGGLGLILGLAALLIRETRAPRPLNAPRVSLSALVREVVTALRQSPALTATIFGGVALHWGLAAAAFDQLWFVRERGFDAAEIAQLNGYAIVIGGIAGNLLGGWMGDFWQARMKSGRAMLLFWMFLAVTPFTLAYRLVPADSPFFWIGMYAGIFLLSAFYGPTFASVQELAPKRVRGTMTGFFILAVNVFGLGVGITVAGVLIDGFRDAGVGQPYTLAALTCGIASLLAIPAFYLAGRWSNRDRPADAVVPSGPDSSSQPGKSQRKTLTSRDPVSGEQIKRLTDSHSNRGIRKGAGQSLFR